MPPTPPGSGPERTGAREKRALYVLGIFLSAFLVFQIQPVIARTILPWFGGTPAVWSSVMLFFQVALTGGYAYAWWLIGRVHERRQGGLHLLLLAASVALVAGLGLAWPSPVTPGLAWKPTGAEWPIVRIVAILTLAVGLPYFTLATNSPLMQAWSARACPGRSPYWLYALSNVGSLLALATYPVLVEPLLTLRQQGWAWSAGYLLFVAVTACAALRTRRHAAEAAAEFAKDTPVLRADDRSALPAVAPSGPIQGLWMALSAAASVLLLAVTSHITQEVAVIPFLWILPLAIYLLTFVLAFSGEGRYHRPLFSALFAAASVACILALLRPDTSVIWQIACFSIGLFVACMVTHGELYRLRPDPAHLTRFYLMMSVGGALGGLFVTVAAPAIFSGYWELYIGWACVWLLLAVLTFVRPTEELPRRWRGEYDAVVGGLAVAATVLAGYAVASSSAGDVLRERNFYGVLRVGQDGERRLYTMVHGITVHGRQFRDPAMRDTPTAYFWRGSGIGLALANHARHGRGLRVGVLGLGVGTLAAYGQAGDVYRFYEINPLVLRLANGQGGYFSFLKDSLADVRVVLGDARISLERELAAGERQRFDVLALDAFSSDSLPVHLITRDAFAVYLEHLAPGGVIAANITNRHLDLTPVLWQIARASGLKMVSIRVPAPADRDAAAPSVWILLARDEAVFAVPAIREKADPLVGYSTRIRLWTDDYSNLLQVIK